MSKLTNKDIKNSIDILSNMLQDDLSYEEQRAIILAIDAMSQQAKLSNWIDSYSLFSYVRYR